MLVLLQEASPLTVAEADAEHMSFTLTIDEYDEIATSFINGDRQPFEKLVFGPTLRQFKKPSKD